MSSGLMVAVIFKEVKSVCPKFVKFEVLGEAFGDVAECIGNSGGDCE